MSVDGDESLGLPQEAIFSEIDADAALEEAAFVLEQVKRVFQAYQDERREQDAQSE